MSKSAFPKNWDNGGNNRESQTGMSIREYLAGQVLQGLSSIYDVVGGCYVGTQDPETVAKICVSYAKALEIELDES